MGSCLRLRAGCALRGNGLSWSGTNHENNFLPGGSLTEKEKGEVETVNRRVDEFQMGLLSPACLEVLKNIANVIGIMMWQRCFDSNSSTARVG